MSLRPVKQIIQPKPTIEGAGVKLQRAFGFGKTKDFDPFLLLDDFRNDNPADYVAGFPWHPHRGIETITYVLAGSVEHGDSLGNKGKMTAGDVQWMTTGSAFAYVFGGAGTFRDASDPRAVLTEQAADANAPAKYDASNHSLVLFDRGDEIVVQAGDEGIRFLLVSGKPIEEPVAWYGPIVMNTQEQLQQAMAELQSGAFIKHR